jgi:tocopherol cyclase
VPSFAPPLTRLLRAYRRTGADPPFGDPSRYHGSGLEGHFWRFTQPATGEVVVVIAAVSRDGAGRPWGMACVAAHPGAAVVTAVAPSAWAGEQRLGLRLHDGERTLLAAGAGHLEVDLGPQARLAVELDGPRGWGRRALGGIGAAQVVPGLSQYWHPHLLHATARGAGMVTGRRLALDGASAYAEKNWGAGGMPRAWWWGQAHGFGDDGACVAFAGGRAGLGALHVPAGSLVVALPGELLRLVRPLQPLRVDVGAAGWRLRGRTVRDVVDVEGHAAATPPHRLPVPVPAQRRVVEAWSEQHLAGTLQLVVRRGGRIRFRGVSELAGLEQGRGH